ncbi:MAG TPA: DUF2497 domain-containing protein [Azospirillaceae bacterium]|nr:DUF2497 domain-containing protein [Azospirillaceae bacterium]
MDDDVLDLTQMVSDDEPAPPPTLASSLDDDWGFKSEPELEPQRSSIPSFDDDLDALMEAAPPPPSPPPPPLPPPRPSRPMMEDGGLMSASPASQAIGAFSELTQRLPPQPGVYGQMPVHSTGPTVEDVVKTLLRPLLREWLDDNLPLIVERLVKSEIEKLVRRARDF